MTSAKAFAKLADSLGPQGEVIPGEEWDARIDAMWSSALEFLEVFNAQHPSPQVPPTAAQAEGGAE